MHSSYAAFKERYQSATEVLDALESLAHQSTYKYLSKINCIFFDKVLDDYFETVAITQVMEAIATDESRKKNQFFNEIYQRFKQRYNKTIKKNLPTEQILSSKAESPLYFT